MDIPFFMVQRIVFHQCLNMSTALFGQLVLELHFGASFYPRVFDILDKPMGVPIAIPFCNGYPYR